MKRLCENYSDLEFLYLTQLTRHGLKPLSRWESKVNDKELALLKAHDLDYALVERRLVTGSKTIETVFSRSAALIEQYVSRFQNTYIDKTPENKRFEGRLFGYPSCCIENFIHHPYRPNSLSAEDQKLLFHWACPNCSVTPILLPQYRAIYQRCLLMASTSRSTSIRQNRSLENVIATAATVSFLLLNTLHCSCDLILKPQPYHPDSHLFALPSEVDADQDFLENRLEPLLQLDGNKSDSDHDGVPDGPDLAQQLWLFYRALPDHPRKDGPYVENYMMRGLETCNVCNETVNMGYAIIVNPLENLSLEVPYIFLHHFFEHGSFSYDGNVHGNGRMNAALLKIILTSDGKSHWLGESYSESEVQEYRALAARMESLPRTEQTDKVYAIDYKMKGIEMCHCCGDYFNMGYVRIHNPMKKIFYDVPYIALHFLRCGGNKFEGDENVGAVDISALKAVLE
ncbi:hypothetical protein JXO59_05780 [candidate division KSB1 bacterium]|nr:hypothetical protein [candidate division KSB1 bacterium]